MTVNIGRHGCQKEMNVHLGGFELECIKGEYTIVTKVQINKVNKKRIYLYF